MDNIQQKRALSWLAQQAAVSRGRFSALRILCTASAALIALQFWFLADLLQQLSLPPYSVEGLVQGCWMFCLVTILRAIIAYFREKISFSAGQRIRAHVRQQLLAKLVELGPSWLNSQPAGSWSTTILEQVENLQEYFSRYLPQRFTVAVVPLVLLTTILPVNWFAALLLILTAPLIPIFMVLVGKGAAEANRRNFLALARLGGHFLDRLQGLETLQLFNSAEREISGVAEAAHNFRIRTMEVLRSAFLSSAVLEFFTSISIALLALYFGFSYLGIFSFGGYRTEVTLFAGLLTLMLAPEFYRPLRDLGTFYHAKAQAVAAAKLLLETLNQSVNLVPSRKEVVPDRAVELVARQLEIYSPAGERIAGPLDFFLLAGGTVFLVGPSGAGKSSMINLLLGFLPYRGSITINGVELRELCIDSWRSSISWVGQNPQLISGTILENIKLGNLAADAALVASVVRNSYVDEFLPHLHDGLDSQVSGSGRELSVGQAQRVAVARALLVPCKLLLLDEPTASLDHHSARLLTKALTRASRRQTSIVVTHRVEEWPLVERVWLMEKGLLTAQKSWLGAQGA